MSESIWDDPRITAYVLGEMPDSEVAAFEQSLESDPQLAEAVQEARGVTTQLEGLYANEPTKTLDADRRNSLTSRDPATPVIPRSELATSETTTGSWRVPLMMLATAAALLLLIGGPQWFNPQDKQLGQVDESVPPARSAENANEPTIETASETATKVFVPEETEFAAHPESEPTTAAAAIDEQLRSALGTEDMKSVEQAAQAGRQLQSLPQMQQFEQTQTQRLFKSPSKSRAIRGQIPHLDARSEKQLAEADTDTDKTVDAASIATTQPGANQPASGRRAAGSSTPSSELSRGGVSSADASGVTRELARPFSFQAEAAPGTAPVPMLSKNPTVKQQNRDSNNRSRSVLEGDPIILRGNKGDLAKVERVLSDAKSGRDENISESIALGTNVTAGPAPMPASPTAAAPRASVSNPNEAKGYRLQNEQPHNLSIAAGVPPNRYTRSRQTRTAAPKQEIALGRSGGGMGGGAMGRGEELRRFGRAAPNYWPPIDEGRGPGVAGDRFDPITDNEFKRVSEHPLSTFSVDVDTASYSKTRDFLTRQNSLPRPDAVRIEELVNYFDYEYLPPKNDAEHPFATVATIVSCPWNEEHRLARIALKGKTMEKDERPRCNLVFLLDTSGSMNAGNKLPLVIEGMKMLLGELDDKDKVAITVYAGSAGLVLDSTAAKKSKKIRKALTELSAGGSTNGGAGIALAYQTARDNFIPDGVNRVILCTDGDFNVGTTGTDELVRMVEKEAKGGVFLSVLGFGMGNHNDAMLEQISGRGNGNYAFIDSREEARKVLVDQTSGTLVTIAKDVKFQIEFNPNQVSSYRLIGYENRVLAKEDFNDDKKDAGEIGAGHAVTALYELVPAGVEADASPPKVDDLKYQAKLNPTKAANRDETMTLKLRYKQPDGDTSTLIEIPVTDDETSFEDADHDARFAAAVAGFGMQLRRSKYAGNWTLSDVIRTANDAKGEDEYGLRAEFVSLAERAQSLMGQE